MGRDKTNDAGATHGGRNTLDKILGRNKGAAARQEKGLGTFLGVFTPTVLTILGVIMYLRFGWVIGHVGIARTLLIVILANGITLITTISFSAVATNTRVGVGGAYFIISRSLGLEIGGAIGLPLYLSQVFSVTLYAFGLAESLRFVVPELPLQPAAFVIVLGVGGLTFFGADLALKIQIPIMIAIGLSLVALTGGALTTASLPGPEASGMSGEHGFWVVFAVFFPAVTGVMAGLGLSGDLRNPGKSIPIGSLAASLVGLAVYLGIPFLLTMGADAETLRNDPLVWTRIAPLGALLILPGLWGAIFSSAVGSMLGAPRTLQALSMDHLAPKRLSSVDGKGGEPVVGLIVSMALAIGAIFLGNLNAVAEVVAMFFLTVYGMVNLVAALETMSGDTSWRPRLKAPWLLSLIGAVGCFAVMFLINPIAGAAAIGIELILWLALQRKERRADWGDARRGIFEALIRWALLRLAKRPMTARNWRPHVLLFAENIERRLDLVRFGSWFSQGRGVVTICELVVGDLLDPEVKPDERRKHIDTVLLREGIQAFSEVDVVRGVEPGIIDVAQANGMAGLESNTVILGWRKEPDKLAEFFRVMRRLEALKMSVLIGRSQLSAHPREGKRRTVDVWWGGLQRNGDLMLLLAHLLTRNPAWRGGRIRIRSIASNELMKEETERFLADLIPEIRIEAEVKVVLKPKERTVREIIHEESANADVVFLGLGTPPEGEEEAYAQRTIELVAPLPTFFLVKNSSLFVGELVGDKPERTPEKLEKADSAAKKAPEESPKADKTEKKAAEADPADKAEKKAAKADPADDEADGA